MKSFIEKATELKHDAVAATHAVEDKTKEAAHDVQGRNHIIQISYLYDGFIDKATELKHDTSVATHDVQEKAKEVAHNIQGKFIQLSI
jgi:hypothetical protein